MVETVAGAAVSNVGNGGRTNGVGFRVTSRMTLAHTKMTPKQATALTAMIAPRNSVGKPLEPEDGELAGNAGTKITSPATATEIMVGRRYRRAPCDRVDES